MAKEERLQRRSHKLLLVILKLIPVITAFCYMLNTVLALFGVDAAFFSHICGMSLLPWLFILIAEFVNTVVHEIKHVQSHICMYYGVPEDGEDAAYLIGYLVMRMYKCFKNLL